MPSIVVNFKTIHSTAKNLTNWVSIWFQRFNYHRSRSFGYRRVPISDLPDRNKIWKIYFISWLIFSISDRLVFMIGLSLLFIKNVKKIELNCYRMFYFSSGQFLPTIVTVAPVMDDTMHALSISKQTVTRFQWTVQVLKSGRFEWTYIVGLWWDTYHSFRNMHLF